MTEANLHEVIASALELSPDAITDEATTQSVSAWDSLGHLKVVLAVESAYKVKFSTAEIRELVSVRRLREELQRRNAL